MAMTILSQFVYTKGSRVYLSISYHGPKSKCGISRYAGMLADAVKSAHASKSIYCSDRHVSIKKNFSSVKVFGEDKIELANWNWVCLFKLLRTLKTKGTTAHFHFPPTKPSIVFLLAPIFFRLAGCKVYQTWHEELSRAGWIKAIFLRLAGRHIFIVKEGFIQRSSLYSRWILNFFKIKCVGTAPLQTLEKGNFGKKKYSTKFHCLYLVIGFVFPKRNIEMIIKNLNKNSEQLIIAGDYSVDPVYYQYLIDFAEKLDLKENVKFLGFVEDARLSTLFQQSTAIIFSNHDGVHNWNTSFLLSCYSGRPVVYFYDKLKGKPDIHGFTESSLDFGVKYSDEDNFRLMLDKVKTSDTDFVVPINLNEVWLRIFDKHELNLENNFK